MIRLINVSKQYSIGGHSVMALRNIHLAIQKSEMVAIMGPSGSGKSTLMNIIGLLDRPSEGELYINGENITLDMSDGKLAHLRSMRIGFIFQSMNLLPRLTALDNVLMPTMYCSSGKEDRVTRAKEVLQRVGLSKRYHHRPTELSGGEKQRVAIARALINQPEIILADEPTGNLDSKSGDEVLNILQNLQMQGKTVLVITHDTHIAEMCKRTVHLFDGMIK